MYIYNTFITHAFSTLLSFKFPNFKKRYISRSLALNDPSGLSHLGLATQSQVGVMISSP